MPTKTHTYEEQRVVTETHTKEVTYCSGCGFPIAEGQALPLFHGPDTEADHDIHLHPGCYQVVFRPPDGGVYEFAAYDDWLAFADAASQRDRQSDAGGLYAWWPALGQALADTIRALAGSLGVAFVVTLTLMVATIVALATMASAGVVIPLLVACIVSFGWSLALGA